MAAPKGNKFSPGRPVKPINWNTFEKLCEIQCTQREIANILEVDANTLHDRVQQHYKDVFADVYNRFADGGRASFRRTQLKLAQKSASMAIFLGKQKNWLGQTDLPPETPLTEEKMQIFADLMKQLSGLQLDRKIEDSNKSSEQKSA